MTRYARPVILLIVFIKPSAMRVIKNVKERRDRRGGRLQYYSRPMAANYPLWGWLLIALFLLSGCAMMQSALPPEPSSNAAVQTLLNKAHDQAAAGRMDAAGANLERALRIEPRNPVLWQELARVRLDQHQYRQAENLAAKSNALAGGNRYLERENWRIIGEARNRRGDIEGERSAFEKAEE